MLASIVQSLSTALGDVLEGFMSMFLEALDMNLSSFLEVFPLLSTFYTYLRSFSVAITAIIAGRALATFWFGSLENSARDNPLIVLVKTFFSVAAIYWGGYVLEYIVQTDQERSLYGKYVTYAYLPSSSYPVQAYGGWLQVLFGYMEDVNVDLWVHKESPESIQRRLQFELKNKRIQQKNTDDIALDFDDIVSSLEAGFYIKQQLASGDDFCYISAILTIYANSEEELNDRYREMRDYCIRNDMNLKRCMFQQDEAFLATIPTSRFNKGIYAKSKRNVMASQLGSCYPFTAYELCDRGGVFLGINARYGSPVFVNMFDTAKYQNANMMIFGPSGSGKTYTLLCMLLRMRQKGTQIYIIAPLKGFEFYRACSAIGGQIIQIAPGSAQNINIMEIRKKDTSDSDIIDGIPEGSRGSILVNKVQQLHRFFSLLIPDMTAIERQVLDETLVRTYGRFGITSRNKSLINPNGSGEYKVMPVLGDLHKELEKTGEDGRRL